MCGAALTEDAGAPAGKHCAGEEEGLQHGRVVGGGRDEPAPRRCEPAPVVGVPRAVGVSGVEGSARHRRLPCNTRPKRAGVCVCVGRQVAADFCLRGAVAAQLRTAQRESARTERGARSVGRPAGRLRQDLPRRGWCCSSKAAGRGGPLGARRAARRRSTPRPAARALTAARQNTMPKRLRRRRATTWPRRRKGGREEEHAHACGHAAHSEMPADWYETREPGANASGSSAKRALKSASGAWARRSAIFSVLGCAITAPPTQSASPIRALSDRAERRRGGKRNGANREGLTHQAVG
eukprot:SAG11_NODE_426_length_9563_cov_7.501479_7_plen_296_part_00